MRSGVSRSAAWKRSIRFAKVFGAEAESLMMDRHDEMSAGFIGHVHGLFRSAVRMNPGIVSADRHDRQIDGTESAQLRKRIAQRGVAAENDATVISLENVAVVTAIGVALLPRAPSGCQSGSDGTSASIKTRPEKFRTQTAVFWSKTSMQRIDPRSFSCE